MIVEKAKKATRHYTRGTGLFATIQEAWDSARDEASSNTNTTLGTVSYDVFEPVTFTATFLRGLIEFDLSTVPNFAKATSVVLEIDNQASETEGVNWLRVCQPPSASISSMTDNANYGVIKTAYEAAVGTLTFREQGPVDIWQSGNLIDDGLFDTTSSTVYYGITDRKDALDEVPSGVESRITNFESGAILILTIPDSDGSTSRLTTSMRRRF